MATKSNVDVITINHNGVNVEVDLNKPCPTALFSELNVPWKRKEKYIPATLVREVIRTRKGIQVIKEVLNQPILWSVNAVLYGEVGIDVDGEIFMGTSMDTISLKKLATTSMWQAWHISSLALKSALKKRFKFFEWDYTTAEAEESAWEEVSLDYLTKEVSSLVTEKTPEPVKEKKVEEKKTEPVVEKKNEPTPLVEAEAPAPKKEVEKKADGKLSPAEEFERQLHIAKGEGETSLDVLVAIGKKVREQYNVEAGSIEHTELLNKAGQLKDWFVA